MTTPTPMTEAEIEEVEKRFEPQSVWSNNLPTMYHNYITRDEARRLLATIRERDKVIHAREWCAELLRQFVEALDAGAVQIASQEIDGEEARGPDDPGHPAHPWHDEWLHYVREALASSSPKGPRT